jgi:hypothetical protein
VDQEAKKFSDASEHIKKKLEKLKDDFAEFVGTFSAWSADREKQDKVDIERLREDVKDLRRERGAVQEKLGGACMALAGITVVWGISRAIISPPATVWVGNLPSGPCSLILTNRHFIPVYCPSNTLRIVFFISSF